MKNEANNNARVERLSTSNEDYREITHWLRKSFKSEAKAANRKGRRAARRNLRTS